MKQKKLLHAPCSMLHERGFTLIEAIVSTAIFAFVVSSIVAVYIAVLRLDTRTRAQRLVANDARFIMEFFAKEIRNGRIAYENYPNQLTCKEFCGDGTYRPTDLFLVNQGGEAERIYFWDRTQNADEDKFDCRPVGDICDIYVEKAAGRSRLNSENVRVTLFKVYTAPWGDPFAARVYNQQPNVTIVLELTSNINSRDVVKMNVESTFTTQYYPQRP